MSARLSPATIFRAHWRALSDYRSSKPVPDVVARGAVVVLPLGVGVGAYLADASLRAPDALLTAVSLLAGGFLAAFTHLSGVRSRLTDRAAAWGDAERIDRDAVDETAAHLLAASYVSGLAVAVLVAGMNLGADKEGALGGTWGAAAIALLVYIFVVFLITLPRLYSAYATSNAVRDELNGLHRK